jgi:hypothetical protein
MRARYRALAEQADVAMFVIELILQSAAQGD